MTVYEIKQLAAKIVNATEEEKEAVYRAYINELVADTDKWIKENNYFLGE